MDLRRMAQFSLPLRYHDDRPMIRSTLIPPKTLLNNGHIWFICLYGL